MDDSQIPDRAERFVRFGCGSIVGVIFGVLIAVNTLIVNASGLIGMVGLFAVVFGVLALRFGDRFWYALRHMKWFWP